MTATDATIRLPDSDQTARVEAARLRRRQISHDIHHELSTIMLLAALLRDAPDVGPDSMDRVRLILGETRWLDQLQRAYEEATSDPAAACGYPPPAVPVRLDQVAGEVVVAMRLSTLTKITFAAVEVATHADRLALWRALRNVVDNAVRAAGVTGHVDVRISVDGGWAVAQVDDDGPGFSTTPAARISLGLGIVQDLAAAWGGQLEIRRRAQGGCRVRLLIPLAPVPRAATDEVEPPPSEPPERS